MNRSLFIPLCLAAAAVMTAAVGYADVPNTVSYQGHLVGIDGQPVDSFLTITFAIFDDSATGAMLWSETHPSVEVAQGAFSVVLGSLNPIPDTAFGSYQSWLEVVVGGEAINPRTRLTAMPYSYASRTVSGDIETSPGHLSVSLLGRSGPFLDLMANQGGANLSMASSAVAVDQPKIDFNTNFQRASLKLSLTGSDDTLLSIATNPDHNSRIAAFNPSMGGEIRPLYELSANPTDGGWFSIFAPQGDFTNDPFIRMGVEPTPFRAGVLEMFDPYNGSQHDPLIRMGVEPSPFIGGRLTLLGNNTGALIDPIIDMRFNDYGGMLRIAAFNDLSGVEDSAVVTQNGMRLFRGNVSVAQLSDDGFGALRVDCGSKAAEFTKYGACAMTVEDSASDTLMVFNEDGLFMGGGLVKGEFGAFLTPDSFKLAAGAADGYVLTSDANGVGSWQAPTGGGGAGGWVDDGSTVRLENSSDKVGIGNSGAPAGKLHVYASDGDEAVYAMSTFDGTGIAGYFQGGQTGVHGFVSGGAGNRYGVEGQVNGDFTTNAVGVYGITNSGLVTMGVYGHGQSGGNGTFGVVGTADGTGNEHVGVSGTANDGEISNIGVEGLAYHPSPTTTNYGIKSAAYGDSAINYGIYAEAAVGFINYAGWFQGDVHITGNLTGGGSFGTRIDHPLDPDNMYLQQSFIESPEMKCVFDGNVTTDADGLATVQLPDYCEALSGDFRYQLTAIGSFAQVIVKEEIANNRFVIQSAQPFVKVSWQVTGIRKDAQAEANRGQVEVYKPANERGR